MPSEIRARALALSDTIQNKSSMCQSQPLITRAEIETRISAINESAELLVSTLGEFESDGSSAALICFNDEASELRYSVNEAVLRFNEKTGFCLGEIFGTTIPNKQRFYSGEVFSFKRHSHTFKYLPSLDPANIAHFIGKRNGPRFDEYASIVLNDEGFEAQHYVFGFELVEQFFRFDELVFPNFDLARINELAPSQAGNDHLPS